MPPDDRPLDGAASMALSPAQWLYAPLRLSMEGGFCPDDGGSEVQDVPAGEPG